ncbi:LysR family transcriptional regulator [Photobacterium sanctipauli]|uniref:LysR family transcriptional regulator n=3 Tax=Photobacterium sanctipauli TaxID=1342794 RepID=A0A2T3NND7_9GAMM|nr:LysR family transcriptional regulator [Photobacterium sanctipauli]PSW17225.1 LysR family transcriptional regulator [Photobacterium sanctipauli]
MNISSRQLQAFLAVAHHESFTEAAEQLHLTQPSLSNQIRQLEAMLRVELFERTTRRVVLSDAGRVFLPTAEKVLNRLTGGVSDMHEFAAGTMGKVTFAALLTVGASLVPVAMFEFQRRNPKIVLEYIEESDEPIYQQVLNGDLDFGIGAPPSNQQDVEFIPIYKDYLHFVCSPEHPLAEQAEVSWQQIVQYPFIAMKGGMSMRHLMEKGFALTNTPLRPVQTATYQSTILGMVACGIGVSVLPSSLKIMFKRNDVRIIPITESLYRDIGLIIPTKKELSIAAKEFISVFRQVVDDNNQLLPSSD